MPFNLPRTVDTVRTLRSRSETLRIVLGGRATRKEQALAQALAVELDEGIYTR
jgi:hypothetical protein